MLAARLLRLSKFSLLVCASTDPAHCSCLVMSCYCWACSLS